MNAYFCLAPDREYVADSIDGWARMEHGSVVEVIYAETRGKAKALFVQHSWDAYLEWTDPMSVRLVGKNVDMPAGIAKTNDPIWDMVPAN